MLLTAPHDRYLIYQMLGREVEVDEGEGISGVVQKICRNIFHSTIELTVSGQKFSFDEPAAIFQNDGDLVFAYGDLDAVEVTDEELFREVRGSYGDSINDVLKRTKPTSSKTLRFSIGDKVQREKRRWRRRK